MRKKGTIEQRVTEQSSEDQATPGPALPKTGLKA